ncbi:MAG: DUF4412 domain-containing protein [Bacteroidales bacterium]|nr:DUF4412 domain-containing protein [Bacteroidales bacterium]
MNKLAVICCSAAFCLFAANTNAQKSKAFSGSVKFEIKYEGDFDLQQLSKAPRETEQLIFGNYTKTTQNLGGAIMHRLDMVDSIVTLLDTPTEKYAISTGTVKQEENENEEKNYVIRKRADSKDICGYNCQGYDIVVTVKSEEEEEDRQVTIVVYTTEAIGIDSNINKHTAPGLKGFVLYQERPAGEGKKIITQAVEVKKKKVQPIEFSIPSNYKYFTQETWMEYVRQMQGGQAGDEDDDF